MFPKEKNGLLGDSTKGPIGNGDEKSPLPMYTTATASSSQTPFQTQFASLSMHMEDRLRFLQFPNEIVNIARECIRANWSRGIQDERMYAGSKEIKLYGNPWRGSGDQAVEARRLICKILGCLHEQGWVLSLATDISKKTSDKDTLLFRHQVPSPASCDWLAIGFSKSDRIKFIDAPSTIPTFLTSRLAGRVQDSCQHHMRGVWEIKLAGSPWWAEGTETMRVRELLLTLLSVLEGEGWTVYASVDQKNGGEKYTETDTWHCCRPRGWVRGAPVYHG
ncbi:hypothetical protein K469DRAFT_710339 [Zopfia rhizophila CBS 207.26]|uniref:Uncharacterized protein n=1 Tax=Zopfia rhizophila CBS 207.26 TaxID=1314779 RepID=A0A6A6E075_9PEZI|nr:hypothetical protein K469DRAFT_710339 [Zopfia rhizophila CBS 207.26]